MESKYVNNHKAQQYFKLIVLLTVAYLIILPFRIMPILRIIRIVALLLCTFFIVNYFLKFSLKKLNFICLVCIFFVLIISIVYSEVRIDFNVILSVISIFLFLNLITTSDIQIIDKQCIKFLYKVGIFVSLLFIIYSRSRFAYWDGERYGIYLTLGIENANTTAIYIFFIYSLLMITMDFTKHKLFTSGILVYLLYLVFLTNSRTVVIACLLLPLLKIFYKKKINKRIILICTLFPIIFIFFYLYLYHNFDNLIIMGKTLFSGRQQIYANTLRKLNSIIYLLIGNFSEVHFDNVHNGPLSIFGTIGLIGGVCFYYILISKLLTGSRKFNTISNVAIITLLCCFIHSSSEVAMFVGGFPGITFMFVFYVLINYNDDGLESD